MPIQKVRIVAGSAIISAAIVAAAALLPLGRPVQADDNPPDAIVVNSGSTNMLGYRIDIPPKGDATYTVGDQSGHGPLDADLVKQFYADIAAASPLANLPRGRCMKSASFGSSTRVSVGDDQSPDIRCPGNDEARALHEDAKKIAAALNVANHPRHQPNN